jgi:hypothetical protein
MNHSEFFASRSRTQLWGDLMTSFFLPRMGCFYLLLVLKQIEIHSPFFCFYTNSLHHPIFVAKAKSLTPPEKAAKSNANNNRLYSLASNAKLGHSPIRACGPCGKSYSSRSPFSGNCLGKLPPHNWVRLGANERLRKHSKLSPRRVL